MRKGETEMVIDYRTGVLLDEADLVDGQLYLAPTTDEPNDVEGLPSMSWPAPGVVTVSAFRRYRDRLDQHDDIDPGFGDEV